MIFTALIKLFVGAINLLFDLLPATDLPDNIRAGIQYFFDLAHSVDAVFPVNQMLLVALAALTFEAGWLTFRGIKWTIHLIRGN
jgi:hypothetical protein